MSAGGLLRRPMEYYDGLMNGCAPGTHQGLVDALLRNSTTRSGVLDLGAGSGALLARLRDAGFSDLHAADLASENFRVKGIPHTRVNLNGEFLSLFDRKFRIVCLSETLEHLDAPRRAVAQIRDLLEDDGILAVTVPNVGFWEGRLKFMLKGELWGFGEATYRSIRHISPMTADQLRLMLEEIGFRVSLVTTAGSFATPLRRALLAPLWIPIRLIGGARVFGECLVVLARRGDPDVALSRPTSYAEVWDRSAGPAAIGVGSTA